MLISTLWAFPYQLHLWHSKTGYGGSIPYPWSIRILSNRCLIYPWHLGESVATRRKLLLFPACLNGSVFQYRYVYPHIRWMGYNISIRTLIYLEMWIYEEQKQHFKAGVISRCTILSHGMLSFGGERISTSCKIRWYSCKDIFRDAAGNSTYAPGRVHIWQIGNLIRIGHKSTLILWEI